MTVVEILQNLTEDEIRFFKNYRGGYKNFESFFYKQFSYLDLILQEDGIYLLLIDSKDNCYYCGSDVVVCYLRAIEVSKKRFGINDN